MAHEEVASHSLKMSCWRKYPAIYRHLKLHLSPSQNSLHNLRQEGSIVFILYSNKKATFCDYRGQRNSFGPFILLFVVEAQALVYKLILLAWFQKLVSFRYLAACFSLIFHFLKTHFKGAKWKAKSSRKEAIIPLAKHIPHVLGGTDMDGSMWIQQKKEQAVSLNLSLHNKLITDRSESGHPPSVKWCRFTPPCWSESIKCFSQSFYLADSRSSLIWRP